MRRAATLVVALLAVLAPAGCSSGDDDSSAPVARAVRAAVDVTRTTAITVTSTTTTAPPTSTTTTTTTASPTTVPPTTLPPLPVPVAPPPEDGSTESRVEIGSIEIPRIGLVRPMFEGIRLTTLDHGPGHWPGTAMPGDVGNVVVAGHRVSHNSDFRNLDRLVPGDEVIMSTLSGRHVYAVTAVEIVEPDAMWIVDQTYDRTATLFACHPPGSVRQRIVVHLSHAA